MRKVIKFEKNDCIPCKSLGQWLDDNNVEYTAVNAFDDPGLAGRYKVRSLPTLLIVEGSDDMVIERFKGFKPEELVAAKEKGLL